MSDPEEVLLAARVLLDASAVLAYLEDEPGALVVEEAITRGAALSAVNLAEVLEKVVDRDRDPGEVSADLTSLLVVLDFTEDFVVATAEVRKASAGRSLSLGDRACLGTALVLGIPVLTADQAWTRLPELPIEVRTIR